MIYRTALIVYSLLLIAFLALPKNVMAQVVSLDPSSATKAVNEEFIVNLNIDTKGKAAAASDVKITFDPTALEVVGVTNGDFFSDVGNNPGPGTLYVGGGFRDAFQTKTGLGKLAAITLKGKKEGTAQFVFVCTTQKNDTNISDAAGNDIVDCSGVKNGNYTFTAGTGPTNTPGPTSGPTSTPNPGSPTATATPPVSGISLPTILSIGMGAFLIILGIAGVIII